MGDSASAPGGPPTIEPAAVLEIVAAVRAELHPGARRPPRIDLDSALERDLGFDSVTRVELIGRLERHFDRALPEAVLAGAETPRDLVRALEAAAGAAVGAPRLPGGAGELVEAAGSEALAADEAATLMEVLDWHASRHPDRLHVLYLPGGGEPEPLTYADLRRRGRDVCGGLQSAGIAAGERVGLMLPSGLEYFAAFFGILLAGAVPVPLYPPARPSQIGEHLRRQARILATAEVRGLIAFREVMPLARLVRAHVPTLESVSTVQDLAVRAGEPAIPARAAGDIAFLQFTSGSTADPKGVVLTHENLLSNLRAIGRSIDFTAADRVVSWLPLYHDMGLIGAWMGSLYFGVPLYLMSPVTFLARPSRWLWAVHEHRGTLSAAPNFAYELCLNKIPEAEIEGLDLSSWRATLNGAEPVSADTLRRFVARFEPYGLRPEAVLPVYGLAECSLALAFPEWGRPPRIDAVRREPMAREGLAVPAETGDATAIEFVSCGRPLPGHEIRVADASGNELEERREGRLQFRGPSATSGYFRNPQANRRLLQGGWLDSGDLGYISRGEVFVTGRAKDLIIRAGRNIYPQEIEEAVGAIDGVRKGCTAVFGSEDPASGTERLVVLVESRLEDAGEREALRATIQSAVVDLVGSPADDVALVALRTVPKTSSGKLRRAAARELYETGRLAGGGPVWWQIARLALASVRPQAARTLRSGRDLLHAGRFWVVVGLAAVPVGAALALLPRLARRRRVARQATRRVARLTSTPIRVRGAEHLEGGGPWIVAANHASYLDGFALTATLPVEGAFLAKKELRSSLLARLLLERLGTLFVERFDPDRGLADLERAQTALDAGESLLFFPEGTFDRAPGLRRFRLGAFVVAARCRVPVVPVAIRGSRSVLRGREWFPRKATITVTVRPPIAPDGDDWSAAVRLRDRVRAEILAHCGEPDLVDEPGGTFALPR